MSGFGLTSRSSRLVCGMVLLLTARFTASAQDRPSSACPFDGFSGPALLAEVSSPRATQAYIGCPPGGACKPVALPPRSVVFVYKTEGAWTCGYLTMRDGAGPGWVQSKDLRAVPADAAPPRHAWLGTWVNGEGRILITAAADGAKLKLEGHSVWKGGRGVEHTGDFEGEAASSGNRLHFVEGGADSCTIDLTLVGPYLAANDNNMCGGMNVRFWGVWKRAK